MTGGAKGTLTTSVYGQVRADLLAGRLQPGQKLRMGPLSTRFSVSLSVIREALTRLAEQGLVVATPHRGFAVVALRAEDLLDLTQIRVDIETLAVRRSVENGDLVWETGQVAAHHTLARTPFITPDGDVSDAWMEAHRSFHEALLAGCGSPRLRAIAGALRDSSELYRIWSRSLAHDEHRDIAGEHHQLMEFATGRRALETAEALGAHIERTTEALLPYLDRLNTGDVQT